MRSEKDTPRREPTGEIEAIDFLGNPACFSVPAPKDLMEWAETKKSNPICIRGQTYSMVAQAFDGTPLMALIREIRGRTAVWPYLREAWAVRVSYCVEGQPQPDYWGWHIDSVPQIDHPNPIEYHNLWFMGADAPTEFLKEPYNSLRVNPGTPGQLRNTCCIPEENILRASPEHVYMYSRGYLHRATLAKSSGMRVFVRQSWSCNGR